MMFQALCVLVSPRIESLLLCLKELSTVTSSGDLWVIFVINIGMIITEWRVPGPVSGV